MTTINQIQRRSIIFFNNVVLLSSKRLALLVFLFLTPLITFAQTLNEQIQATKSIENSNDKIRALKHLRVDVERANDDILKAEYLVVLINTYQAASNYSQVEKALNTLSKHAETEKLAEYLAIVLYEKGLLLKNKGMYMQALVPLADALEKFFALNMYEYQSRALRRSAYCLRSIGKYQQAISAAKQAKNIAIQHELFTELDHVNSTMSTIYSQLGLYQEALSLELQAFNNINAEHDGFSKNAGEYYSLAHRYLDLENYPEAIKFFTLAYQLDVKASNLSDIGHSQIKLAQSYLGNKDYKKAMEYSHLSLTTFTNMKVERHIAWSHSSIGNVYLAKKEFPQALQALTVAEKTLTQLKENELLNAVKLSKGKALLGLEKLEPAQVYFNQVISYSTEHKIYPKWIVALENLIMILELQKHYPQALVLQRDLQSTQIEYLKDIYSYRSSLLEQSLDNVSKNSQINLLTAEKSLQEALLQQEQSSLKFVMSVAIIIGLLLFISMYLHYSRQRFNQEKQALANKSLTEKQQLFTDISHELRTPLSVIKLQIQALEYNISTDKSAAYNKLYEKMAGLDRLIEDIYQLARIDSHTLQLTMKTIDVNRSINDVILDISAIAKQHQLSFSFDNQITQSLTFNGDFRRLQQVFLNVMQNSMKYTDAPGQVRLITRVEGGQLMLSLEDSAPSVPTQALPHLFERLYRTDNSRNSDTGGSGLGLSIAKGIVELHHGEIYAEKSDLGGIKVTIALPLVC